MTTALSNVLVLAQQAFALALHRICPGLWPKSDEVRVKIGPSGNSCIYEVGEVSIYGWFYPSPKENSAAGSVYIGLVEDKAVTRCERCFAVWTHLEEIPKKFQEMHKTHHASWHGAKVSTYFDNLQELRYFVEMVYHLIGEPLIPIKSETDEASSFKQINWLERVFRELHDTRTKDFNIPESFFERFDRFMKVIDREDFRREDDQEEREIRL